MNRKTNQPELCCCTLPNGDEWHLPFRHFCGGTSIKLPLEKLKEVSSIRKQWTVVDFAKSVNNPRRMVGPFLFTSITFPE